MAKRMNIALDDEAAARLLELAGSPRKQGEYLSRLIMAAPTTAPPKPASNEVAELRRQMTRLAAELATVTQRLLALDEG